MMFKIKRDRADELWSKYLRKKHPTCEYCKIRPSSQCSHFYGRRNENTRFDEENCDAVCFACHNFFHENPPIYVDWKKRKLGEQKFKLLQFRAEVQYHKKDRKLALIYIKKLIKESGYDIK